MLTFQLSSCDIFENASAVFFSDAVPAPSVVSNSDVVLKKVVGLFTGTGDTVLIGYHENSK